MPDTHSAAPRPKASVAVLLAGVAGCVNVWAFRALGDGFVAHLSGDTSHAAMALANAKWLLAAYTLLPVPAFVFGAGLGRAIADAARAHGRKHRLTRVLLVECALLVGAYAALTQHVDWLAIVLASGGMGLQNAALRHVAGHNLRTTFVTGMLVALADDCVAVWLQGRREERSYLFLHAAVWLAFGAGGALAALAWLWGAPRIAYAWIILILAALIVWDISAPIEPT